MGNAPPPTLRWWDRLLIDPVDHFQQRVAPVAFLVAVSKRFSEDRGPQYAALLAYYGFFSLLAILLVLATLSATFLANNPERQQALIDAITERIPVTGTTVADNVQSLNGSGLALLAGVLFVAWSGLGVVNNAQVAFNTMWSVPRYRWPAIWSRLGRSVAVLSVVGVALLVMTAAGPLLSALDIGALQLVLAGLAAVLVNALALLVCLQLLTATRVPFRDMVPGALAGAVALLILQFIGTWYMTRVIARAGALYGAFAAAIGLLVWIALQARLILMANEVNVVRTKQLWPRSLTARNLTDGDRRAHEDLVQRQALFDPQHATDAEA